MMTNATSSRVTRLGSAIAFVLVLVAIIALVFGLLSARPAYAATFTVNSSSDGGDNDTTDNSCFTGNTKIVLVEGVLVRENECTLRAAVQQANATPGSDTITFSVNSITLSTLGTLENAAE